MSVAVAARWDETLACVECGGWNARWSSRLAGHSGVTHVGDLSQYCRDCKTVYDVTLSDYDWAWSDGKGYDVRMHPEDVSWSSRKIWYHAGRADWDEACPGDAWVHVGHKDTSMWLARSEYREALYTVKVVGEMPKRLVRDKGDGWDNYTAAYVNRWETVGRVSLYLPKKRLEVIDKVEL